MSRMGSLVIEIQEAIAAGEDFSAIAQRLNVPLSWVWESYDMLEGEYDDSMDGDAASALASVGWGTDEDYSGSWDDIEF